MVQSHIVQGSTVHKKHQKKTAHVLMERQLGSPHGCSSRTSTARCTWNCQMGTHCILTLLAAFGWFVLWSSHLRIGIQSAYLYMSSLIIHKISKPNSLWIVGPHWKFLCVFWLTVTKSCFSQVNERLW